VNNFLIAETSGEWYILYYVLTWQRWLIADARKGAAHGGLNFTGDTLEELTHALHNDYEDNYTHTWRFQVAASLVCWKGIGIDHRSHLFASCV
jgi:hypothetical protein